MVNVAKKLGKALLFTSGGMALAFIASMGLCAWVMRDTDDSRDFGEQ